jgi:hypothetical protein
LPSSSGLLAVEETSLLEHERSTASPLHTRYALKLGLEYTSTRARSHSHFLHNSRTSALPCALPATSLQLPFACQTLHCEALTHLHTHIALHQKKGLSSPQNRVACPPPLTPRRAFARPVQTPRRLPELSAYISIPHPSSCCPPRRPLNRPFPGRRQQV